MKKKQPALGSIPLSARFRPNPDKRLEFIPGQMIVKIKSAPLSSAVGTLKGGGAQLAFRVKQDIPDSVSDPLEYLKNNAGLKRASALFADESKHSLHGLGAARVAALASVADSPHDELSGYTVVTLDPKKVTPKLMKHVSASKAIQFVEQMPARWISRRAKSNGVDPMQKLQWSLGAIGWFNAKLPTAQQAQRVKVAVLDSGIDRTHPEFRGVVASYDHKGSSATDVIGHGTHVAGIIAALTNNSVGISGMAACQLAVWKIFDDDATDGDFYVNGERYLQALGLLADSDCRIVNLSIGGTQQSRTEAAMFHRLRKRNILPIAAMGNEFEEGNPMEFPAAYPGVVAVGAITSELRRASFSNTGRHIWVVAPGHTILSTVPLKTSAYRDETKYAPWSGTSMATPHVCAAASLYWAKHRSATADQVESALRRCAKRLAEMKSKSFTSTLGYGLIQLQKLLA